jgi:hypothetical protein
MTLVESHSVWVGDTPTKIIELSLGEFSEVVRSNKIGIKTKYIVRKSA